MNDTELETLSALLDNQANDLELRRVLKSSEQDSELLNTWERMNLVQAVLHDEYSHNSAELKLLSKNFSQNVAASIAREPTPSVNKIVTLNWGQAAAKVGIAASVALAFFLGMQITVEQQGFENEGGNALAQKTESVAPGIQPEYADVNDSMLANTPVQQVDPQARLRLEEYIRSVPITPEEPVRLDQLKDSPLYRLVNEIKNNQ